MNKNKKNKVIIKIKKPSKIYKKTDYSKNILLANNKQNELDKNKTNILVTF
jgi:hypothetical protein